MPALQSGESRNSGQITDPGENSWDDLRGIKWDSPKIQESEDCENLHIIAQLLQTDIYFRGRCFRVWFAMLVSKQLASPNFIIRN